MEAKKKKRRGVSRIEMVCVSVVVMILLSFMLVRSRDLRERNEEYVQKIEALNKDIQKEQDRSEEIAQLQEEVQTSEFAGEIARERLGLVGEDEILFQVED